MFGVTIKLYLLLSTVVSGTTDKGTSEIGTTTSL